MTISERHRIAQELHDGIAQDLVGIGYSIDLLLAQEDESSEARTALRTLRFTVTDLIEKVRQEIFKLRQQSDLGLSDRIQRAVEEICEGLEIHSSLDSFPALANFDLTYQVERIAVEVFRNIAAHSRAKTVWVTLICKGKVAELIIRDDGIGGLIEREDHYGFSGLQERAQIIGATLESQSSTTGTQIHLRIPIEQ
ncbi:MAG: hypothetical protein HY050_05590 [Actinobacteria bacterium]|nr:hypothetical protein [Actinomycetota bacterium]